MYLRRYKGTKWLLPCSSPTFLYGAQQSHFLIVYGKLLEYISAKMYRDGIPQKSFRFSSDQIKRQTLLGKLPFVNCSMAHYVVIQFPKQQMSEYWHSTVQTKTSTKLSKTDPKLLAGEIYTWIVFMTTSILY